VEYGIGEMVDVPEQPSRVSVNPPLPSLSP